MNHIILKCNMFSNQEIMVYKDGACIKDVYAPLSTTVTAINALRKEYDISNIDLCGQKDFLEKIKSDLTSTFYENEEVNINIVEI